MVSPEYPQYYFYEERPVVLVQTEDGSLDCQVLDYKSGEFRREMRYYFDILFKFEANSERVTRDEFIQWTERQRAHFVKGEGPVFALYGTVDAVKENAVAEGRHLTDEERALIHTLRERTHEMFEEMLRESGRNGMPPGT